jgi:mannose-6-phosphate isomerase-like protein (cupin superfamily)
MHDMPRTSTPSPAAPRSRPRVATDGAALTFETLAAYDGVLPPLRIRPDEATLLRVVSGSVRLTVLGDERRLEPGDEAIVPAGHAHRLAGDRGEARLVMGFRSLPL